MLIDIFADGVKKFLVGKGFFGIGEKKANALLEFCGEDFFSFVEYQPEKLLQIPGVKQSDIEVLRRGVRELTSKNQGIAIFCKGLGLSGAATLKVISAYGDEAAKKIKEDPYALTKIKGVGFKIADKIAYKLGADLKSPQRYTAAAVYALNEAAREGHTFLPDKYFNSKVSFLMGISCMAVETKKIALDRIGFDGNWFLKRYRKAERDIEERLLLLNNETNHSATQQNGHLAFTQPKFDESSGHNQNDHSSIKTTILDLLDDHQQALVDSIITGKNVQILTGGAGVGKTTILSGVLESIRICRPHINIGLVAPTGKAAFRMMEKTGHEAFTIHKFLKARRAGGSWSYTFNADNRLPTDFLIIDEASMVDTLLMRDLLVALRDDAKVLFVGDVNQLSPVGAGRPFKDIINSDLFLTHRLNKVYRSKFCEIPIACQAINDGEIPKVAFASIDPNEPVCFSPGYSDDGLLKSIVDYVLINIDAIDDIQILAAMKRGVVGTENINQVVADILPRKDSYTFTYKSKVFRSGDRVMNTANNYDLDLMNGEIGKVCAEEEQQASGLLCEFNGRKLLLKNHDTLNLLHGWAITVHKSQGSEFKTVIIPVTNSHSFMMTRSLVYTAATRASEKIMFVGDEMALLKAIKNTREDMRFSRLFKKNENN